MCRSIKVLRGAEPATMEEVEAAALQFVRKIAGMRKPSQRNEDAFESAVEEITKVSVRLLEAVGDGRHAHANGIQHSHAKGEPAHTHA